MARAHRGPSNRLEWLELNLAGRKSYWASIDRVICCSRICNQVRSLTAQSASIARTQGLLESFCGSSPGRCSQARRKFLDELTQKLSSKPCDLAIDTLSRMSRCIVNSKKNICLRFAFSSTGVRFLDSSHKKFKIDSN